MSQDLRLYLTRFYYYCFCKTSLEYKIHVLGTFECILYCNTCQNDKEPYTKPYRKCNNLSTLYVRLSNEN